MYYLDAVTQVINAALYQTMIPSTVETATSTTSFSSSFSSSKIQSTKPGVTTMDSNIEHSIPLIPRNNNNNNRVGTAATAVVLPTIISTHVMVSDTKACTPLDRSGHSSMVLIADASTEEANLSSVVIHVVIVPTDTTTSTNGTSSATTKNQPSYTVGAVWKTKSGTISKKTLEYGISTTQQIFAPHAYSISSNH